MKNVLVINDCKFESIILKDMLTKLNYHVKFCGEALVFKVLADYKADIILVNYIMEKITGDQLIYEIKKSYPNIACILFSNNYINKEAYRHKKVDGVLHTPIKIETLSEEFHKVESNFKFNGKVSNSICPSCGAKLSSADLHEKLCLNCGKELIES
jgi:response regulator RpfG family c-di-GMP phosphodiesterase